MNSWAILYFTAVTYNVKPFPGTHLSPLPGSGLGADPVVVVALRLKRPMNIHFRAGRTLLQAPNPVRRDRIPPTIFNGAASFGYISETKTVLVPRRFRRHFALPSSSKHENIR